MSAPVDLRSIGASALPMALASLSRTADPGEGRHAILPAPDVVDRALLADLATGAGFALRRRRVGHATRLTRFRTLPDTVGPGMRLLVCGLNPSPAAADDGVGFARPGNRFWPAALAAGLVTRDRDPDHALTAHGVGMTDVVKRTTRRADELESVEYVEGLARLVRMVDWLEVPAVCFVGLAGWRAARDRRAGAGWQAERLGGARVYLMPSTSGLNASSRLPDLTDHLRAAAGG
ncbi:MAG: mismatch-specific DNA-glycosylase [Actinomycetota bacterium]